LWDWAAPRAGEIAARDVPWGLDYAVEERDGDGGVGAVRTGLARRLDAGESGDEEEGDDDDEEEEEEDGEEDVDEEGKMDVDTTQSEIKQSDVVRPMMPLEDVMRFMSVGSAPRVMGMPPGGMR